MIIDFKHVRSMNKVFRGKKYIIVAKPDISSRKENSVLENIAEMNTDLTKALDENQMEIMNKFNEVLNDMHQMGKGINQAIFKMNQQLAD